METGGSTSRTYNCEKCQDTGFTVERRHDSVFHYDYDVRIQCECAIRAMMLKNIRRSGLESSIERMTFDNFEVRADWQREALNTAKNFKNGWLLLCGQVGSGKTHLGTAVVGEFLRRGKTARYMLWRDDSVRLKAVVTDDSEYSRAMEPLKRCDLLYIDDFFKTERGKRPTQGDINLAHELLNYRYVNQLPTIISCELSLPEILDIDEAVGSRIYQMSKGQVVSISHDPKKNWRLR